MNQTITVSQETIEEILTRLDRLTREIKAIRTKLFEEEPPYGSDEWWEWSDKKSIEDYKKGRYTVIRSKKELNEFFSSLGK
ncbi:MAG: hypothetical protein A3B44_00245 [Candidatus Levybacteria bacterium RIFCSPLOWO2_01_FULL_38_21]|nr:MAG: hypothetical protein A3B44_00245 [Candidatus Levybacteria bacterium RIFCSPLOWO2_01_FULL_38_21]